MMLYIDVVKVLTTSAKDVTFQKDFRKGGCLPMKVFAVLFGV